MSKDDRVDDIAMQLRLLQQCFDAFDEAVAARLGLNRTDLRCLDVVLGSGPLSAGEISAAVKLSPAATTTAIDRLERAGYASRTRDHDNRRRVLVTATDAARTVEAEIFRPVGQAGAQALSRYNENQLAVILDFLQTARRVQQAQTTRLTTTTSPPD
ncbi:MarR family transcriptional regulator [Streptomyces sp. NBC_00846]|uniref:MarR family winged helix-turn-helix transcriptional regulator n=1 Tax=Streptomyces sp. NBC_00846 TaxID=2975849 RepID=UPI0038702DE1|nr:MarR family transcriptional regulator [Streptomyces sp. NBC_00846]